MKFNVGDKVAVTDDVIKGVIITITGNEITIKTTDDFVMKFTANELVKIDIEQSELAKTVVVSQHLAQKTTYKKGKKRSKIKKIKGEIPPMEVDLHIEKLVKSTRGMDNYDILSLQMDTAKHKIEFAIRNRIPRVVFIHGVGAGVLKTELKFLLNHYNVQVSEASYQKYGMGATEVYIYQNRK